MSKCRICQNSISRNQTFCSHCGARQSVLAAMSNARKNPFTRLTNSLREAFRSEEKKRFDDACQFAIGGFNLAVPRLEGFVRANPRNTYFRETLAIFYAGAGDELFSHPGGFPGGPWQELTTEYLGIAKAGEILSWVTELKQLEYENLLQLQYHDAYEGLNEALNSSLSMYDKSLRMDPKYPGGYSGRASVFQEVADLILRVYDIFPTRFLKQLPAGFEGEPVHYGRAHFGICVRKEIPDLGEFAAEILWLYEQAEKGYREALLLNATDTVSYVKLSHVLQHLGQRDEARNSLHKALAILNRAIQIDNSDKQSCSERAVIFEELGEIESAISDLERLLTLSTSEFELGQTRRKIEELQKSKEVTGEK